MRTDYFVAIVDDEPGMRVLMRRLLELQNLAVRCYDCAESLLRDDESVPFGCIVLDIALTGISGIELLSELRRRRTQIPIVMVSGRATVSDAVRSFQENANAFLEKTFDNTEFVNTVTRLTNEWASKHSARQKLVAKLSALSPREREVLDALVLGKKTIQIAHELEISPSTVEKHRIRVFEKMKVDSVVQLVRMLADEQVRTELW